MFGYDWSKCVKINLVHLYVDILLIYIIEKQKSSRGTTKHNLIFFLSISYFYNFNILMKVGNLLDTLHHG